MIKAIIFDFFGVLEIFENREQSNQAMLAYVRELKPHYKLAILSNANQGVLQHKLQPNQLTLFDALVASAEVGYMKPDPEIYKLTAQRLGVQPAECIFIDDGQAYCEAAEAVGMKSIWYQNFAQFKQDLAKLLA